MNEMTAKEIIQALECCIGDWYDYDNCPNCPYYKTKNCGHIQSIALDLIKQQQAEIERLNKETEAKETMIGGTTYIDIKSHFRSIEKFKAEIDRYKGVIKLLENDVKNSKADATKEFAERLKPFIWIL